MDRLIAVVASPRALPRWAVATLVANVVIVGTGGLVRLTGSGLGCPTWPKCTDDSYVTHPALGYHGLIEFGNRLLTFGLILIAALTFISALLARTGGRPRRDLRWQAAVLALGIPAQGVIGGISVLTKLNPYVVALHFGASMVLIGLSVWLVRRTRSVPPAGGRRLGIVAARVAFAGMVVAVWLGTLLTGSGPHAGDTEARRTGLKPWIVVDWHATAVYLAIAATLVALVVLRSRAALLLICVETVQAVIGIVQYNIGLPIWLVVLHMIGAALAVAAATNLLLSVSTSRAGSEPSWEQRLNGTLQEVGHRRG